MSTSTGIVSKFFSALLKAYRLFRSIILNAIFLLIFFIVIASIFGDEQVIVPQGSALVIAPNGIIVEQERYIDPIDNLMNSSIGNGVSGETLLRDILNALELAQTDDSINSLVLQLGGLQSAGFSKLQAIGAGITEFKRSGKKVYALSDSYSQAQYYLASYADEILLNPYGSINLEGFSSYQIYYGSALEKLGINMHIFRVGEYKSAVEPYERDDMSEAAKESNLAWLDDLWQLYVADIVRERSLEEYDINFHINNLDQQLALYDGDNAQLALEVGLVDTLADRSNTLSQLGEEIGVDNSGLSYKKILLGDYLSARQSLLTSSASANDSIAVIIASGTILDGSQRPGNIGGDSLAQLIFQARSDEKIKALVLRIDSPGGSAFASEIIRSELLQLKAAGKKLVVSMGSVAASGGYWIASPADQIWASPSTITGSIGIYGIYPSFENSFEILGINTDGVGTTNLAGSYSVGRNLPQTAINAQQLTVQNGYDRFLSIVSQGRNMTIEEVDTIAQGRVWSGTAAHENGLVDELGNLDEAIVAAANLAEVSEYDIQLLSSPLSPGELLIKQLTQNLGVQAMFESVDNNSVGEQIFIKLYQQFNSGIQQMINFNDPQGLYLQCFDCVIN